MDEVELNFCWKLTKNMPEVLSTPIMIDISSAAPVEKKTNILTLYSIGYS